MCTSSQQRSAEGAFKSYACYKSAVMMRFKDAEVFLFVAMSLIRGLGSKSHSVTAVTAYIH